MIKTRCKNLTDGSRIAINDFIVALMPYTFDELVSNEGIFAELFPNSDMVKDIHDGETAFEIEIDDYIFSFFRRSKVESPSTSTYAINDTVAISSTITVWLSDGGGDVECEGKIKHDGCRYYLSVTIDVE